MATTSASGQRRKYLIGILLVVLVTLLFGAIVPSLVYLT